MASTESTPATVFISYSSLDRAEAFQALHVLERRGCTVWLDYCDIKPGAVVSEELAAHVSDASVLCLLLSPTSVASPWVAMEMRLAREHEERGLRVVPVILRSCRVPPPLAELPYVDARDGIASAAIRLAHMVAGTEGTGRAEVLSEGERAAIARQEVREEADRRFPALARELDRVRDSPIREITVSIDPETLPPDSRGIIELQLVLDPLWSAPMSLYFARYREGATWPADFGFREPPHTAFFLEERARVDCKLRWYDEVVEPRGVSGAAEMPDRPAEFTLTLSGEAFQPKGEGPHLLRKLEVPSLQKLHDDRCRFRLIAHDPVTRTARYLDEEPTDLDVTVSARFAGQEPHLCRLYRSRHSRHEQDLMECRALSGVESSIEREALLGLYPADPDEARRAREQRLREALEQETEIGEEDRRLAARLAFGEAQLAVVRGQHLRALQSFQKCALLLQPVVFEGYPTFAEGVLMYRACRSLVGFYLQTKQYRRAADFVNGVGLVAQRLMELDGGEPDHRRMWADALEKNAIVHAENGDLATAVGELTEAVDTWRALASELATPERRADARRALAAALDYATRWKVEAGLPLGRWRAEVDPDGALSAAVEAEQAERAAGPVWLRPLSADPEGWPTAPFESGLLRFALRIPKRWPANTEVRPVSAMETSLVLRGPWPTEWLIVSLMDKATPGGRITDWVDVIAGKAGFPVLEMTAGAEGAPKLLGWSDEGSVEAVAQRLDVDVAHAYSGLAQWPGEHARLGRIYILLAARKTFAWKITMAFESACLPGMQDESVAREDHVRAAATLGSLRLG